MKASVARLAPHAKGLSKGPGDLLWVLTYLRMS